MKANILILILINTVLPSIYYAHAIDSCSKLPKTISVKKATKQCGNVPTVVLKKEFKNSFSAAFRWDDGSDSGQDRSPFALNDSSASSSPYKSQKRIRSKNADYLCYGRFIKRKGFLLPIQLTIKPTIAPVVKRYCVNFK